MQLGITGQLDQGAAVVAKRPASAVAAAPDQAEQVDSVGAGRHVVSTGFHRGNGKSYQLNPAQRDGRTLVIIHGTIVDKESLKAYNDFAVKEGRPVDFHNYPTITDGGAIQESAQIVSQNINDARLKSAKENLLQLQSANSPQRRQFFHIDGNLYGKADPSVAKVEAQIPWLMGQVESAVGQSPKTFSSQIHKVENELSKRLGGIPGWTATVRDKVAGEMVESIVPKVDLVGHSAGGFVAYALAVNPPSADKPSEFTYDGALGVGNVTLLSAPVGKGISTPLPPAMAEMGFYQWDKAVFRPMEDSLLGQMAMLNPFAAMTYSLAKSNTKLSMSIASQMTTAAIAPAIYAQKPGYEQVTGDSSFFKKYVKNQPIPDGVTVVAVTSPDDRMSLPSRSKVDDKQPNGHNFSADLEMAPGEVERERPTWGHVKMGTMPAEFKAQFVEDLVKNPDNAARFLDPSNDDGARYEVLQALQEQIQKAPDLLDQDRFSTLKEAIATVAKERLPFSDSPSALAQKMLFP